MFIGTMDCLGAVGNVEDLDTVFCDDVGVIASTLDDVRWCFLEYADFGRDILHKRILLCVHKPAVFAHDVNMGLTAEKISIVEFVSTHREVMVICYEKDLDHVLQMIKKFFYTNVSV